MMQVRPSVLDGADPRPRLRVGAVPHPAGGASFRVWAPRRGRVEVVIESGPAAGRAFPLETAGDGWHEGLVREAVPGTLYRYRLDGAGPFPDPASRRQPQGVHGPSQIVDPRAFRWTDQAWRGPSLAGAVIYELHVGTFSPEGTFEGVAKRLEALRDVGITVIELMPIAEFPGRRGWGYDGVDWFAPTRNYGAPDDLRRLVDRAHALGMAVILDVVYNHFGPDGAWWREYAEEWFSKAHRTDWGEALNFDGPGAEGVREHVTANAAMWIDEYHIDGLRLDATQDIQDDSPDPILAELTRVARAAAAGRRVLVFAENEPQVSRIARAVERGGMGLDGLWNDDFHHAARVAATGRAEAYFTDYRGTPQELISTTKWGYLFQGQRYAWQEKNRGEPAFDLEAPAFVTYLENHDQVANTSGGKRLQQLTSPGRHRALTAFWLLGPGTPLLFQGQEWSASAPWHYFCDHEPNLAPLVRDGRADFLRQFPSAAIFPDPGADDVFAQCRLDWAERERNTAALAFHRDLLRLRREDRTFRAQRRDRIHGAVLAAEAFALRWLGESSAEDRLLLVNLGGDLAVPAIPEPLVAPPEGARWRLAWSSEDPAYGGSGTPPVDSEEGWRIPGHAAVLLVPGVDRG
jgi:maltooligosyltrehalose trehalohydrolase